MSKSNQASIGVQHEHMGFLTWMPVSGVMWNVTREGGWSLGGDQEYMHIWPIVVVLCGRGQRRGGST